MNLPDLPSYDPHWDSPEEEQRMEAEYRKDLSTDCKIEKRALLCSGSRIDGVQKVKIGNIKI